MRIVHAFYAGLGGHTSVFFAHQKYAKVHNIELKVCMYGIEEPLKNTIEELDKRLIDWKFVRKHYKIDFRYFIELVKAVDDFNPDIVFLHSAQLVPFLRLFYLFRKKRPQIIVRETQAVNLKSEIQKLNSNLALLLADQIIFLSEEYRTTFFSNKKWKKNFLTKTAVIPNGLDIDYYKPHRIDKQENLPLKIGMISRLVPIKDHITLIDAIALLTGKGINIDLLIAGDGVMYEPIVKYIEEKELADEIKMLGLVTGDEIVDFFQQLDIYVHSSMGETMSNSIMQAQAAGLPIIATDVFGINNVIKNEENGFLFALGDKVALTQHIENLISDSDLRRRLGDISRKYAIEHLADEQMFQKYLKIFLKA